MWWATRLNTRAGELTVGTFNVRTLALNGKNGLGHAEEILDVWEERDAKRGELIDRCGVPLDQTLEWAS